ncbi:MAG: transporter substrate-binding domain-containing protein [Thiobacillus sp.]|nr:transporter substrate-binding domain-containing protein [Thiobacillus sp.]
MKNRFHVKLAPRAALLLILGASMVGVAPSAHAANEPTLVLNDANSAPFTNEAGTGLVDIVATEAFRRAGLKLKLVQLPAERALINANAGIEDGEISRVAGIEKAYPNLIPVPEKLVDHHFVAFTRDTSLKHASWDSLRPYSVGFIRGYKIVERNIPPGTQTLTANNAEQLMTMLDKGRVDIAIYRRWEGEALAQKMGLRNLRILEPSLAETGIYIYLHKKHSDKVPLIATALRNIRAEGLFTRACREAFAGFKPLPAQCDAK